MGPKTIGRHL